MAIGLVTTARAAPSWTASTARAIDSIVASALAAAGRPGASSTELFSGTTGRPFENAAAAPAGSVSMTGVANPARFAAAARRPGAAKTKNGALLVRSRHAASASSGPIPAGSPIVIASGGLSPVMA